MKNFDDIPLRTVVDIEDKEYCYEGFNRHMKDIRKKTRFSMEYTITFCVYAFPLWIMDTLFYWSGASFNACIIAYVLFGLFSLWVVSLSKEVASKREIMEKCFYFNPFYTSFLLSHPVVHKNVIDHLNFELLRLCNSSTSSDGIRTSSQSIRHLRRKAAEKVCKKILEEINQTENVFLIRAKRK